MEEWTFAQTGARDELTQLHSRHQAQNEKASCCIRNTCTSVSSWSALLPASLEM